MSPQRLPLAPDWAHADRMDSRPVSASRTSCAGAGPPGRPAARPAPGGSRAAQHPGPSRTARRGCEGEGRGLRGWGWGEQEGPAGVMKGEVGAHGLAGIPVSESKEDGHGSGNLPRTMRPPGGQRNGPWLLLREKTPASWERQNLGKGLQRSKTGSWGMGRGSPSAFGGTNLLCALLGVCVFFQPQELVAPR